MHEIAYDQSVAAVKRIQKIAKKAHQDKAIRAAARRSCMLADNRFHNKIRDLLNALEEKGYCVKCWSRPIDENDSLCWPAKEVAIVFDVEEYEKDLPNFETCFTIGKELLENEWPFVVAPAIDGHVVKYMAMNPSLTVPLPDVDFFEKWNGYINLPFLSSELVERFEVARDACLQISSIINCYKNEKLHPDEDAALGKACDKFKINYDHLSAEFENNQREHYALALEFLEKMWNQVVREFESAKSGKSIDEPLYTINNPLFTGKESEWNTESSCVLLLLYQAECMSARIDG